MTRGGKTAWAVRAFTAALVAPVLNAPLGAQATTGPLEGTVDRTFNPLSGGKRR